MHSTFFVHFHNCDILYLTGSRTISSKKSLNTSLKDLDASLKVRCNYVGKQKCSLLKFTDIMIRL